MLSFRFREYCGGIHYVAIIAGLTDLDNAVAHARQWLEARRFTVVDLDVDAANNAADIMAMKDGKARHFVIDAKCV